MHAKAIPGSYKRTGCDTVKVNTDLVDAAFFATDASGAFLASVKYAVIQAEAQIIRFTTDGTVPTASLGFQILVGERVAFSPAELRSIKVIGVAAGGFANCTLYSA